MVDASGVLLRAATSYAVARLRSVLTPDTLAAALGQPAPPDPTAVAAQLAAAQGHVDAAASAAALDPPDVASVGGRLWFALGAVRSAAGLLGVPDPSPHVVTLLGATAPGGIVSRLGLGSPRVRWTGESFTVGWSTGSPSSLVPGTTLRRADLQVTIAPGGLSATVGLGDLGLDLAAGLGGAADAVLSGILGAASKVTADVSLTASRRGLTVGGSAGPVSIPGRADAGIAALEDLRLGVRPDGDRIAVVLSARLTGELGPLAAVVDGLEAVLRVDPRALVGGGGAVAQPAAGGAVRGIGLSLDTGVAKGGGYLTRSVGGQPGYGGVLQLRLGPVDVKAFGILRERDGATSFVAVMSVELDPAVELGLGFTLNGVGGLLGQGVTVDTTALAAGLKDGAVSRILFPPDPVAAAPQVLGTLATVFPTREDGFVIGPMVALGWGRPTLARLDVAVVLALPDPVVVILGRARAAFPSPEAAVIDLRASLLAQFGGGIILVRVQLEASRVGFATVQGGFGLLARFGGSPTFVVSAGGFHPRYTRVPPELAGLDRISAELAPPIGFQMRISGYVALTPNTLQLGGSVEIGYSIAVAAVRGSLTLDALVEFDPFGLEVDLGLRVDVEALGQSVAGVDLRLNLRGPAPWRVQGTGKVRLPWPLPDPSISVGPIEFGERASAPSEPPVSPLDVAARALSAPGAWVPRPRPGVLPPVVLAPVAARRPGDPPGPDPAEPWALLQATQRAVPLFMRVDRIGARRASPGPCTVVVSADPTVGGEEGARWSQVREAFATSQYVDLSDDEALGAPDFEDRASGLALDVGGVSTTPAGREAVLMYEDFHPFESFARPPRRPWWVLRDDSLVVALSNTATATSGLRARDRYAVDPRPLAVRSPSAVRVADLDTAATLVADSPEHSGLDGGFAAWTDAAATARAAGLSTLHLTRTGVTG
ncbi:DUF6603 domain-containing protein [Oryzobacter sp. R7]|uniref:DUF6603 domain-containing protein n=1 Tax=Oryzobacter faecalis TaxID=3388656 RepID=UPI00398D0DEA